MECRLSQDLEENQKLDSHSIMNSEVDINAICYLFLFDSV